MYNTDTLKIKSTLIFSLNQLHFKILIFLTFLNITTYAQTGPGGIGSTDGASTLEYWIDASNQSDAIVGVLNEIYDLSGNGVDNVIIGNPLLQENVVNGRNSINFNGFDQQIRTNIFINAALYPNLTIVAVYRPAVVYSGSVWGEYNSNFDGRFLTDNNLLPTTTNFVGPGYDPETTAHPSNTISGLFNANTWSITSVIFREDVTNGTDVRINGQLATTFTSDHNPGAFNSFTVGSGGPSNLINPPFYFNGDIAEILVFSEALNDLEALIIENYLSAKYNIPLADNDLYFGDDFGYDSDVAGIGQTIISNSITMARGTGAVQISNPTNLDNGEFLFWGHNNGALEADDFSDVPLGVEARSNRIWYVNEVDATGNTTDIGEINITFELSNLGSINPEDLVLLVDSDGGDFDNSTLITGATDLGNNLYQFQNLSIIANESRFTIGTSNVSNTPLPIELIYFTITEENENCLLFEWNTAFEIDNDYFMILESEDSFNWQNIKIIKGGGTTDNQVNYNFYYCGNYFEGLKYYKLVQVDFDGTESDLKINSHYFHNEIGVKIYPNPSDEYVRIIAKDLKLVKIYDSKLTHIKTVNENYLIKINDLTDGIYWFQIHLVDKIITKKLIKNTKIENEH